MDWKFHIFVIYAMLVKECMCIVRYKYVFGCSNTADEARLMKKNPIRRYFFGTVQKDEWVANDQYRYKIKDKNNGDVVWSSHEAHKIVEPFTIPPGDYICYFSYAHTKYKTTFSHTWYLTMSTVPPLAIISGGNYRTIPFNRKIELSALASLEYAPHFHGKTSFIWNCTQKIEPDRFCKNGIELNTGPKLTIPDDLANGEEITIFLTVKAQDLKIETQQILKVVEYSPLLSIKCKENCPPRVDVCDPQQQTTLEVTCELRCGQISNNGFFWEITKIGAQNFTFDYRNDTTNGRYNKQFTIKSNALQRGNYVVSVKLSNGGLGEARINLIYPPGPDVRDCFTLPFEGLSKDTIFQFFCTQVDVNASYFYELYEYKSKEKGDLITSGYSPDIFHYEFNLLSNIGSYLVKVFGAEDTSYTELPLKTRLVKMPKMKYPREVKSTMELILDDPHGKNKTFMELFTSKDFIKKNIGQQLFYTVIIDMVHYKLNTTRSLRLVFMMKCLMVTDFREFHDKDVNGTLNLIDVIVKQILHDEFEDAFANANNILIYDVSTRMAFMASELAKEVGHKRTEAGERLGDAFLVLARALMNYVMNTSNVDFPADYESLKKHLLDACEIKEKIPDFIDMRIDQYKTLDDLQEVTVNAVYLAILLAKIKSMTLAKYTKKYQSQIDTSYVTIIKDTGKNLSGRRFNTRDVSLVMSRDYVRHKEKNVVIIASWDRDIYWWNNLVQSVSSEVFYFQFWDEKILHNTTKFIDPFVITMDLKNDLPPAEVVEDYFQFPAKIDTELDRNRLIKTRVLIISPGETLRVSFFNLSQDDAFEVVVTAKKFPDMKDFRNAITINHKKSYYYHGTDMGRAFNCYVGILPKRLDFWASQKTKLTYYVTYELSNCVRWVPTRMIWMNHCKEETKLSRPKSIVCKCSQFSAISSLLTNPNNTAQKVLEHNVVIELQTCYIIFYTVLTTFLLYSVFANFGAWKKKEPFYFLSDNLKAHRYSYLLVVRTNNAHNSGTTSNIMVKLIGHKYSSEPHVLNYPDPQLRILQRFGEDTFVLTTDRSLGEIIRIEIWYNCIGASPTWYCRDIIVYDMQERTEWYFFINKRLFILTGVTYIVATPLHEDEPIDETIWDRFRVCGEFHSWYLFSNQEKFAYNKRLTVVLSTMLTNYILSLAIQGFPKLKGTDVFDPYASYNFDKSCVLNAFASSSASFTIHIILAWIFRHSQIQFSKRKQNARLPFCVTLFCWGLMITNIVCSTSLLLIFGFWVPYYKSLEWLTSSVIGIASEILIYDNMVVMIHSCMSKGKLMVDIASKHETILSAMETQKNFLYEKFGNSIFRQHFQHLYSPLKAEQIQEKKIIVRERQFISTQLWDIITFTPYFILLFFLILNIRNPNTLESKNALTDMMKGRFTRTISFKDINTIDDIYKFINFTFLRVMHPKYWYDKYPLTEDQMMIDMNNQFLGVARIRQLRIKRDKCEVKKALRFLFKTCSPEFSSYAEERGTFDYSWRNYSPNSYVNYDRWGSIWRYTPAEKAFAPDVKGQFISYPGGGYIAEFARGYRASYQRFRHYERKGWIDQRTRVVIIELLTYSVNSNMFNAVQLLYEQSATGYTAKTVTSQAARMIFGTNEQEQRTIICFILYHICVVLLACKHFFRIIRGYKTFFKDYWFLIDFVITALNLATIIILQIRDKQIAAFFKDLETTQYKKFINYFYLFYLEEAMNIVTAFVLTIATIRIWQALHFGLIFRIMERTLALACFPLLAATLAFFIILLAFGMSGIVLLGNEFKDFYTLLDTCRTLITMSLKPDQFDIRNFLIIRITYPYFSVYLILMQIILFVYIIIIIMAYMKAQMEFSVTETPYNIKDYLNEEFRAIPMYAKGQWARITGGGPKKAMVQPKADEFRYANCVQIQLSSLQKMKLITKCVLRKIRKSDRKVTTVSANDVVLMLQVCYNFVFGTAVEDDKDLFFKGHFAGESVSLIDEKRIMKMESVVSVLLTRGPRQTRVVQKSSGGSKGYEKFEHCAMAIKSNQATIKECDVKLRLLIAKLNDFELSNAR